jgi:hypothetical protein
MDAAESSIGAHAPVFQEDVAIIGGGNWGSAVAKKIGQNLKQQNDRVTEHDILNYEIVCQPKRQGLVMWTKEEQVNGRSLTDIINETHENVKYLPGKRLASSTFFAFLSSFKVLLLAVFLLMSFLCHSFDFLDVFLFVFLILFSLFSLSLSLL